MLNLGDKLVHLSDIDSAYRHLPASLRPKSVNRHSAFEVSTPPEHLMPFMMFNRACGPIKPVPF